MIREREISMNRYHWSELPVQKKMEGMYLRTIHSERMTVAHWDFEPGVELPEHSHPHEQIAILQEGELELTVDGEARRLQIGGVVVIPPNVKHSGRSLTACRIIDLFSPVRED